MSGTVAVVSAGEMGAQVGAALTESGARVITCLEGRSAATRERALSARMEAVERQELRSAEILLVIVPSDQALAAANSLLAAGVLGATGPLYVDCNPLSTPTLDRLAERLAKAGCDFVDACLLGGPARDGPAALRLCACGERARELGMLGGPKLSVEILPGPLGTASALRRSVSGVSKGLVSLLALSIAHAGQSAVTALLYQELARSHGALLQWVARQSARLPREARRWAVEMREVAAGEAFAGQRVLEETADYLAQLGDSPAELAALGRALERFFNAR